jgi:hypothetical protein
MVFFGNNTNLYFLNLPHSVPFGCVFNRTALCSLFVQVSHECVGHIPPRLLQFRDSVMGFMMLLLCRLLAVPVLLLMASEAGSPEGHIIDS